MKLDEIRARQEYRLKRRERNKIYKVENPERDKSTPSAIDDISFLLKVIDNLSKQIGVKLK